MTKWTIKKRSNENYKYDKFSVNNRNFSRTIYNNGEVYIKSIHPYDNSEYHWAYSKDNGKNFTIFIYSPGKFVDTISGTKENVAKKLLELDKNIEPKRAIW